MVPGPIKIKEINRCIKPQPVDDVVADTTRKYEDSPQLRDFVIVNSFCKKPEQNNHCGRKTANHREPPPEIRQLGKQTESRSTIEGQGQAKKSWDDRDRFSVVKIMASGHFGGLIEEKYE
jgi:hypothetical protein